MPKRIYAIQNRVNQKIYIGCTENPKNRFKQHLSLLRHGRHTIEDMQEDYNKYGDVFDLFLLEENIHYCDEHIEYKYMKEYRSCEREYGYNYKDYIATRINFDKPKEIACKNKDEIINPFDSIKREYIASIIEGLNNSDDVSLFDLILKLIKKNKL